MDVHAFFQDEPDLLQPAFSNPDRPLRRVSCYQPRTRNVDPFDTLETVDGILVGATAISWYPHTCIGIGLADDGTSCTEWRVVSHNNSSDDDPRKRFIVTDPIKDVELLQALNQKLRELKPAESLLPR